MENWQSWAVAAAVLFASGFLIWRIVRRKRKACGNGCGCSVKPR